MNIEDKVICSQCVGNKYLKKMVVDASAIGVCSYCNKSKPSVIKINRLADRIESVFKIHFSPIAIDSYENTWLCDRDEYDFYWDFDSKSPQEIIEVIAGLSSKISTEIVAILSKRRPSLKPGDIDDFVNLFDSDTRLEERYQAEYAQDWAKLEHDLHHKSRFFNAGLINFVSDLFKDIEKPNGIRKFIEKNWIKPVYRARIARGRIDLAKILSDAPTQLGVPFGRSVQKSGRMNAVGIPVFYGSLDRRTCLAEVRAAVGSDVVVGKFEFLRPVSLLNIEKFKKDLKMDIFNPLYSETAKKSYFLHELSIKFSKPVLPEDEAFDYLLTQYICEYLSECIDPPIDGLIFNSTQVKNKKNIVLFQRALHVEKWDVPKEASYTISNEQGDEDDLIILIEKLIGRQVKQNDECSSRLESEPNIVPTLRLDPENIFIERIMEVSYQSDSRKYRKIIDDPKTPIEF
nr:RES family NAD+ phosphorylase [uncultured Undibacterium sp.]